jgi:hypothetical protein
MTRAASGEPAHWLAGRPILGSEPIPVLRRDGIGRTQQSKVGFTQMSNNGLVVVIGLVSFAAGLVAAVRFGPPVPATSTGSVVFWCSRLLAAAALGSLALNAYSIIESQSGNNSTTDSIELANGLILALYDTGVLAGLAAGLAVLGPWLIARGEGLDELEVEATVEG